MRQRGNFYGFFLFIIFVKTCNPAHYSKRTILLLGSITANFLIPKITFVINLHLYQTDLTAIVVFRGKTLVTDNVDSLIDFASDIKNTLQKEEITEHDINGKYHAK